MLFGHRAGQRAHHLGAAQLAGGHRSPRRKHPGVLRTAALAGIDHPRPLDQGGAGQAAGQHPHLVAVVDGERPQVDIARRQVPFDPGGHGRELHHRLGDPGAGVVTDLLADRGELLFGGFRAEHDAVTAGALHRLDHQFADPVQHFFAFVVQPAPVGVDIGQQRFLTEVVLDDGGHVGVDELVIADAVADRAGDHDVAGAGGVDQPGHPEHRVGPEL